MSEATDPDFELLASWRRGDRKAGMALFDRHYAAVSRFFKNKAGDDAEDLVQTTFMKCVDSRDRFEGRSSFRSFIYGVAHNVLRNHYEKKRKHGERFEPATHSVHDLAPRATTMLAKRAEEEITLQALRRLPIDDQVILELYFWENLRAADVGEVLGMPEGTIRTRVRRARLELEELVGQLSEGSLDMERTVSGLEDWVAGIRKRMHESS